MAGSRSGDIRRYSFMQVFANDGTIDAHELAMLMRMALADGKVDDAERAVLADIFDRVTEATVEPEVWAEMERFREVFGID